ncbi:DUF943 family protein [Kalamiella sp. sgz302252]|uniref:DUF943 family protein n=1 Tax=Pantoea sp. sgz302252 TaxID=3341827 RepID=UPI0036D2EEE1
MRKLVILISFILLICFYLYINRQDVKIIDVHYNGHSAEILVDRLPFTDSAKIHWWEKNQNEIRQKYHIPAGEDGPFLIVVYAFGEGYKEEGEEDRRCFEEVKSPRNCIDKNMLMDIWTTREGGVEYEF